MKCSYCGGNIGGSPMVGEGGGYRHYSSLDCRDVLKIQRDALLLQIEAIQAAWANAFKRGLSAPKETLDEMTDAVLGNIGKRNHELPPEVPFTKEDLKRLQSLPHPPELDRPNPADADL